MLFRSLVLTRAALVGEAAAGFTLVGECATVAPGGACTLLVGFAPTRAGGWEAALELDSNDPARPTLSVPLVGVAGVPLLLTGLTATPAVGVAPLEVAFAAQVQGGTGGYTYAWDFDGDGTTDSTAAAPRHTYLTAGQPVVRLAVSDAADQTARTTGEILEIGRAHV